MSFSVRSWLGLTSLLALALPACAQHPTRRAPSAMPAYQTDTFPLSASPCAAQGYPMTIQLGAFVRSDGKTFPVPSGHYLRGDWGASSIGWGVGDPNQAAPGQPGDSLFLLHGGQVL
ncbi:hypothetical protein [Hymenobacter psoromatis]|uniref:hypothetical protein n=1 Tax=Hymenobacter psoromatis TaxID=1484116 RepID=UPI001CBF86BC|nr:hypothetical protein [Hymenobacter psoromatis]